MHGRRGELVTQTRVGREGRLQGTGVRDGCKHGPLGWRDGPRRGTSVRLEGWAKERWEGVMGLSGLSEQPDVQGLALSMFEGSTA